MLGIIFIVYTPNTCNLSFPNLYLHTIPMYQLLPHRNYCCSTSIIFAFTRPHPLCHQVSICVTTMDSELDFNIQTTTTGEQLFTQVTMMFIDFIISLSNS